MGGRPMMDQLVHHDQLAGLGLEDLDENDRGRSEWGVDQLVNVRGEGRPAQMGTQG